MVKRILFLCALVAPLVFGQSAELSGVVTDRPTGSAVADASIEVRNQATGIRQQTATNSDGSYSLPGLKPGTYLATVQAKGFKTLTRDGIVLEDQQRVRLDLSLEVGELQQAVTVTAQKKEELQQDVPVPMTVLRGDNLAVTNQTKIQDYLASVPGLSMAENGVLGGGSVIELRGLGTSANTVQSAPTVGFMIDGLPYGPSQVIPLTGVAAGAPDIDPSDIERIEVLKGPQGTLYGADSLGGVVNIVTKDPSTAGFSGHVQVIGEGVPGGEAGYALRGGVNIPISKDLAIRVSGFDRGDPGYIENVTNGKKNVNSGTAYGGHVSALYKPMGNLTFKLSALYQHVQANGASVINVNQNLQPQFHGLEQTGLPGSGMNIYQLGVYTGEIDTKVAGVNVVSQTSYNVERNRHSEDFTAFFGPCCIDSAGSPFASTAPNGSARPYHFTDHKFSQELRLSSSFGDRLDWVAGGFYTHETSYGTALITANNPVTGANLGTYYYEAMGTYGDPPTTFSEEAVFGNLTAHITPKFDIQVGGRQSWYQQAFNQMFFGPGYTVFGGTLAPDPALNPPHKGSDSAFTFLLTPVYKISPDLMVYARIATGYQIGGTNTPLIATGGITPSDYSSVYGPSKTINYEIGSKGTLPGGRLTFDASVYYIDWHNIQVPVIQGFNGYIINAGKAKSEGVEASIHARPIDRLRITATGAYNRAQLIKGFPADSSVFAPAGTQLPYSMHWSGSLTADMDVMHVAETTTFVGTSVSYLGTRPGEFQGEAGTDRLILPAFTTVDAHIGVKAGSLEWTLYVKNLGNVRGFVGGYTDFGAEGNTGGYYAQVIRPRTIGLSISKSF